MMHHPGGLLDGDVDEMGAAQLLMTLAGRLRRARLSALEPFGLAPHQAKALMIIGRHSQSGDFRPSDLARHLDIAPRSATEVVDALQDKGFVERRDSPTDRRAKVLGLTDAGREILGQMRHRSGPEDEAVSATILGGLTPGELDELTVLLRKAARGTHGSRHGVS